MQTLSTTPRPGQRGSLIRYFAEAIGESDKAVCVHLDGARVAHWIPRSQMQPGSEIQHDGDVGDVFLSDWFVRTARLPQPQGESHHGIRS
jgi:hypothetical protein